MKLLWPCGSVGCFNLAGPIYTLVFFSHYFHLYLYGYLWDKSFSTRTVWYQRFLKCIHGYLGLRVLLLFSLEKAIPSIFLISDFSLDILSLAVLYHHIRILLFNLEFWSHVHSLPCHNMSYSFTITLIQDQLYLCMICIFIIKVDLKKSFKFQTVAFA